MPPTQPAPVPSVASVATAVPGFPGDSRSLDRREGGRWTTTQSIKNLALYVAARTLLFALSPLPVGALRWLGKGLAQGLYVAGLSPRATALENLGRAFPELTLEARRSLARDSYAQLGAFLGEALAQLRRADALPTLAFEKGSREALERALRDGAGGGGVLFASAHLGPWERVAGSLVRHGFALTTVAREPYDPRLAWVYERLRGGAGVGVIYRGQAGAPVRIVKTLRRGGLLGMPMDLRTRAPSIEAPFLGHPAETAVGPARIALRTEAVVVVGTAMAGRDGTVRLRVTSVETSDLARLGRGPEAESLLTARINDELSSRIREYPEGWVWMHARWGRDRAGEPTPSLRKNSSSA